jgi:hypothetical protein
MKCEDGLRSIVKDDETHIEIDGIASTPEGIYKFKDKYAKLMLRYELERKRYGPLEEECFKNDPCL